MILLIGADSGLTIATSLFAETMLPNPMFISFINTPPLFPEINNPLNLLNILNLFPYLFNFTLYFHNIFGNYQIIRLGTNGVYLPVHFLHQEIKLAANRLIQGK